MDMKKTVIDKFKLNNKIGIVTGGYSYLGKYFTEALLETGATVIIAKRNSSTGLS